MPEFWESAFRQKQAMWGLAPTDSAVAAAQIFAQNQCRHVLIPGFGYGRNAVPFLERGMEVTGIEIAETAIALAKDHFGENIRVYHGSVSEMPYDDGSYDGVFCHALIHLLDSPSRAKFIADSYDALRPGGIMVLTSISPNSPDFGNGDQVEANTFRTPHGVTLYFFDEASIQQNFEEFGLNRYLEIQEPATVQAGKPTQRFWWIECHKPQ